MWEKAVFVSLDLQSGASEWGMKGTTWSLSSGQTQAVSGRAAPVSAGAPGSGGLPRGPAAGESGARTYHALLRLDEGPAEAVHLAVEAAGVAQVVAGAVPPPERRLDGAAVHAFATLRGQVLQQVCGESGDQGPVRPHRARPSRDSPEDPQSP